MTRSPSVRPRSGATLNHVAKAAGVSIATASRVLNGSDRKVAEAYRERVEAAAGRLGYTANLVAQATARGTSSVIALLVADIADPYFSQLAAGVVRGADDAGLMVTIGITERDPGREVTLVRALRGQRPRGVILAGSRTGGSTTALDAELDALEASGCRVVVLGRGGSGRRSIMIDNRSGARALGHALAELGYRSAVALAAAEGIYSSDDRLAGFTEGFGGIDRVYRGRYSRESGHELMRQAITDGLAARTVVFAISDVVALGARSAIRDTGVDVALAGFDDIPAATDLTPALTTVRLPLEGIGYAALRAAIYDEWSADPLAIAPVVEIRASTPRSIAGHSGLHSPRAWPPTATR